MTTERRVSVREAGVPFDKPVDTEPNLESLVKSIDKCTEKLESDHGVPVDHFICIVGELIRLFHKFGKGLGLALHGAEDVLKSMQVRRVTATKDFSRYIDTFINNEKITIGVDKLKLRDKLHSGSKAIANLNEMLDFMVTFLEMLEKACDEDKSFRAPQRLKLYQQKLARGHPLFVQAGVKVLLVKGVKKERLLEITQNYCPGMMTSRELTNKVTAQVRPIQRYVSEILVREPYLVNHGALNQSSSIREDDDDFGF